MGMTGDPLQPCVHSGDLPVTSLRWTSRSGSLDLKAANTEHEKKGGVMAEEATSSPPLAGVGGAEAGVQQGSSAVMSLAQQLLQIQVAPVGRHLCDFVVGAPEGAVLRPTLKQVVLILVVSLSYLELGAALAWPNAFTAHLAYDNSTIFNHQLHLTPTGMDLVGSLMFSGTIVSAFPTGFVVSWLGRRLTIVLACLPIAFGWLLIAFAHNSIMIFAGRFICGYGVLMMMSTSKIYAAEITNISFRGMAATFLEVMKSLGYVLVAATAIDMEWYNIAWINAVLLIVYGGVMLALPESPAFLAIQNREEEAHKTLRMLRGPKADVDAELSLLKLRNERKDGNSGFAALFKLDMLRGLAALFVLIILRDFSGANVIMVHTTRILRDLRVTLSHGMSTIIISLVSLCGTVLLSGVVDRIGRRRSIMASFFVMGVGFAMLGFYSYFLPPPIQHDLEIRLLTPQDSNATVSYQAEESGKGDMESRLFPFFCVLAVSFANGAGVSSAPLLVTVEYFPTSIRPQGLTLCLTWVGCMSMVATQLYSTMIDTLGVAGLFWAYALLSTAGMLHTLFFIRETARQDIG